MHKNKKQSGFTLIELMIVVAIIGILAAIAIPNFIRYQLRSKSAEAKTVLGGIKTSEESFRAEYDNYATAALAPTTGIPGTVKTQWTPTACAAGCTRIATGLCSQWACIGYQPSGDVYYQYGAARIAAGLGTPAEFTAAGAANLDGDGFNGSFAYGSSNSAAVAGTLIAATAAQPAAGVNCNAGMPAGEVVDCVPNVY